MGDCLAAALSPRIGCVLTDMHTPEIDDLTLPRRLGKTGCALPVIVMTGHGDVPIAVRVLKTRAVDFPEKPFVADWP